MKKYGAALDGAEREEKDAAPSVLVIDDEAVLARNIAAYLLRSGFEVRVAGSGEEGLAAFEQQPSELVLVDYQLPGMRGLEVLAALKARAPGTRVILMTGNGSEETVRAAFRGGAADYLKKPFQLNALGNLIEGQARNVVRPSSSSNCAALERIVGDSAPVQAVKLLIGRIIQADWAGAGRGHPPSVLVTGETGTGKELVARSLHESGPRSARPFVEVNCAALPASMIESELFGHERGAFTDARERRIGLVEAAAGGTLFLDEIGCLDLAAQAKLLRVLEDRRVRRLGAATFFEVDTRFVAATSEQLELRVREGSFRADLFFRLGMLRVRMPALREREGDVARLATHFLAHFGDCYGKSGLRFSREAMQALESHRWPGNVRELRNVVEQGAVVCVSDEVGAGDLQIVNAPDEVGEALHPRSAHSLVAQSRLPQPNSQPVARLEDAEKDLLHRALAQSGANVSRAARLLGVSRDVVRYRMRKYGIDHSH